MVTREQALRVRMHLHDAIDALRMQDEVRDAAALNSIEQARAILIRDTRGVSRADWHLDFMQDAVDPFEAGYYRE